MNITLSRNSNTSNSNTSNRTSDTNKSNKMLCSNEGNFVGSKINKCNNQHQLTNETREHKHCSLTMTISFVSVKDFFFHYALIAK